MTLDEIHISLEAVDGDTVLIAIATPVGNLELLGNVEIVDGRVLSVTNAHVGGPGRGRLSRAGINKVCDKLLVEVGVEQIFVQGSIRTTGCNPGRAPRPFRYPRKSSA